MTLPTFPAGLAHDIQRARLGPDAASLNIHLPTSAMDQVPWGIARFDPAGRVTYANRTMLAIAGRHGWQGLALHDLFQGQDLQDVLDGLRRRVELREGDAYEVHLTRPDGVRVPISITGFPDSADGDLVTGTFALMRDLTMEKATEAMVKHVENLSDTVELLDAVAAVLRPLVPFDLMQVLRLNKARTHLRTIYSAGEPYQRSYRWWRIPESMQNLLSNRKSLVINDLRAWYAQQRREGLAPDPAIEHFLDAGYTATLSLPVFQEGQQVSSLVLCRKGGQTFSAQEEDTADRLPLTEAASVAQRNDTESHLHFLIRLIHDIEAAYESVQNVSQTVVHRIAEHYGWDYVSIHQVDEARGVIRLIAQKCEHPALQSELLEIDIGRGVVGTVHRTRKPVRIDDVTTDPVYRDVFVRHRQTQTRSELCVPIGPQAHWLLNVEDEKTAAFCPEDEISLGKVAVSLEALLRCTLEFNYRSAVVKSAKDAILLVDQRNMIFEANKAAEDLLGQPAADLVGRPVAGLFEDPAHAEVLLGGGAFANHGTRMLRQGGAGVQAVPVLLSIARLPDETPGRVFIASDLSQYVRSDELAVARALFREITGQVKTPMSLATSWLRRFAEQLSTGASDLPEKILLQLKKAELTLDRMLLIERGGQPAPRFPTLLPLDEVVAQSLADLPAREREQVDLTSGAPHAWVRADAFELRYGVQTVLAYLLRLAVQASRIALRTGTEGGQVWLEIGGRADVAADSTFEAQCRSGQAVAELSLGRQTLDQIAARNGGRFEERREGDRVLFRFHFPSAPSGDAT